MKGGRGGAKDGAGMSNLGAAWLVRELTSSSAGLHEGRSPLCSPGVFTVSGTQQMCTDPE